jgi:hypothetical protein
MTPLIVRYFEDLERRCRGLDENNFILWPTTEINEKIQEWIKERYGCEDDILIRGSRPDIIADIIDIHFGNSFSMLDICCGDAIILTQLKQRFPDSLAIGFDINKGKFEQHKLAEQVGVNLYYGIIQELFKKNLPEKVDIIIMLNTFRSWHTARLREHEKNLPEISQKWLVDNSKHLILTVNDEQLKFFRSIGEVTILGKGEEKSHFIYVSNYYE